MIATNHLGEQIGRLDTVEYAYTKSRGDKVEFSSAEKQICESFFEKESLVAFAREDIFKGIHYPFIFIQGITELRRKVLLEFEPKETLVLFSRSNPFSDRCLDFVDHIVPEYQNRIGQARKFILVSQDPNIVQTIADLRKQRPGMRVIIPFSYKDFLEETQRQTIWQKFHRHFKGVDLFGYKDALVNDWDFVGRDSEVQSLYDAYTAGQNNGLFGLRKIGKTSVLYALMRQMKVKGQYAFYLDCSQPHIYGKRWFELIQYFGEEIIRAWQAQQEVNGGPRVNPTAYKFTETNCSETLLRLLRDATIALRERRFLIILDEIEQITYGLPFSPPHWRGDNDYDDFLKFWQVMRGISQHHPDLLGYIVAGVNPRILEVQFVNREASNPVFTGGLSGVYLSSFALPKVKEMVSRIAMLMGISFAEEMYSLLANEYGGHPFLIRQVCSKLVKDAGSEGISEINGAFFSEKKGDIARHLGTNVDEITSVLEKYYPEEYRLLDLLAHGDQERFKQEAFEPLMIAHLERYGLTKTNGNRFYIAIPAVKERLIAKSRIFNTEKSSGRAKIDMLKARYDGTLEDLANLTQQTGEYSEQIRALVSNWAQWHTIFGDEGALQIYLMKIGEFNADDYRKKDPITGKEFFDIPDDDYRIYLTAFDWVRKKLEQYKNSAQPKSSTASQTTTINNNGGIVITGGEISQAVLSVGDYNQIQSQKFKEIIDRVDKRENTPEQTKEEIKQEIVAVKAAIKDGDDASQSFLEKRLRNIKSMAPDIAAVFLASLISPASGFSEVVRRVAQRVKDSP